jgi:hypothetical protein
MTIYGPNRRAWNRPTREFQVTINNSDHQVYTLDFSPKGLRLGGTTLVLRVGERVNITTKKGDKVYNFTGEVKRTDGLLSIKRIGRSVNGYFIMTSGSAYQEFITQL